MPKREGILSSSKYDIGDHDDVDSIADAWRQKAIEAREDSAKGLLASLEHPAAYEDSAFETIVIDPELIDDLKNPEWKKGKAIIAEVRDELLAWTKGKKGGRQQRAFYALIRFEGPESEVVKLAFAASPDCVRAAIYALTERSARAEGTAPERLPASLIELVRPLVTPQGISKRLKPNDDWLVAGRLIELLLRIDSEDVATVIIEALDREELRSAVVEAAARGRFARAEQVPPAAQARFTKVVDSIAASRKAGLPSRIEMGVGCALAAIVGRSASMAKQIAGIFDLIPGPSTADPGVIGAYSKLLADSIDFLDVAEVERIAGLIALPPLDRLPGPAAAWVRLPAVKARGLAQKVNGGDRATTDKRWRAIAAAHMKRPDRDPEIAALIPLTALAAAAVEAPSDVALPLFIRAIETARNQAELVAALEGPAERRASGALKAALVKLRDTPYKIDAKVEALLGRIADTNSEDALDFEIDGENPFRDRCEALKRVRSAVQKKTVSRRREA